MSRGTSRYLERHQEKKEKAPSACVASCHYLTGQADGGGGGGEDVAMVAFLGPAPADGFSCHSRDELCSDLFGYLPRDDAIRGIENGETA